MPHDRKPPEKTMPLPLPPASLRTRKKGPRNRRFGDLPYAETEILKLHNALSHHGVGDLQEAGNVGAEHHVARLAALDGGVIAGLEDVLMPCSFSSTSSKLQLMRREFWLISRPEVATPPALEALPGV